MLQARGFAQKSDALMLIYLHRYILGTKVELRFVCRHVFVSSVIAGVQVVKERRPGLGRRVTLEGQFEVMASDYKDRFARGLIFIRTHSNIFGRIFLVGLRPGRCIWS